MVIDPANPDLELGITLLTAGFLVSGYLVNGVKYFEGFASDLQFRSLQTPGAEDIRASSSAYGDIYKNRSPEQPLPVYIHLKDARFFSPVGNPIPANHGVWWRSEYRRCRDLCSEP
jgi:hypothetical protein